MSLSNEAIANGKELAEQNTSLKTGACLLGWQLRSPCGESTLPNAKIELDGAQISSNQIKGSKIQWFPRNKLKLTTKYNNRLTRTFNSYGVKYGDFTVVPTARLDELKTELDSIKRDWEDEVSCLINDYDVSVNQHMNENAEIAALIQKYALSCNEFEAKFKLSFTKPLAMKALFEEDEDLINDDVADTLWQEIAKEASGVYKTNWFKDKTPVNRVSQKVRSPFRRMMNKLVDLSFIDNGIENVVDTIQEVLNNLPNSGYIEGHQFTELTNWLLVMANEDTLKLHAQGKPQFTFQPEQEVHLDDGPTKPTPTNDTSNVEQQLIHKDAPQVVPENNEEKAERTSSVNDFGFDW